MLRDYQEKIIENIRSDAREGIRKICCVAPCGAGKTVIMSKLIKNSMDKKCKILFLVHRKELINQAYNTFAKNGLKMKIIRKKEKIDYTDKLILSTIQTINSRLHSKTNHEEVEYFLSTVNLVLIDECHHAKSTSYNNVISLMSKNTFILGFTATPARLDGRSLGDIFQKIEEITTVDELIKNKYLSDFDYYLPPQQVDLKNIKVKFADYDREQLSIEMNKKYVISDIVNQYTKLAKGKRTIIYAVDVKNSISIIEAFNKSGYKSSHIDANTPEKIREQLVNDFKTGKIDILSNVDLFSEGFDVPSCDCVILCRPTMSLVLHIQQSMRCMRIDNNNVNKRAIIIDCAGNAYRFGLPTQKNEWSLTESIKKNKKNKDDDDIDVKIRTCKECYAVFPISNNKCPICGADYTADNNKHKLEKVNAELQKVKELELKNSKIEDKKNIHNMDDLKKYAEKYNYKKGWVFIQAKLRRYI